MAKIKVTSKCELYDGMSITFNTPCDSTTVDGVTVSCKGTTQSFTFRDTHGNPLENQSDLFSEGAYIKAVLDTTRGYAYLQNADTNGYLEAKLNNRYTKEETLADDTKGAFGLPDATPASLFSRLALLYAYWWKRRSWGPEPSLAGTTVRISAIKNHNSSTVTITYSDGIVYDAASDSYVLASPKQTTTVGYSTYTNANALAGKYITGASGHGGKNQTGFLYYIYPSSTATRSANSGDTYTWYNVEMSGAVVSSVNTYGAWTYLHSSEKDAYPNSGIVDGYDYLALGIPFANALGESTPDDVWYFFDRKDGDSA